jgi:hypothetical protein
VPAVSTALAVERGCNDRLVNLSLDLAASATLTQVGRAHVVQQFRTTSNEISLAKRPGRVRNQRPSNHLPARRASEWIPRLNSLACASCGNIHARSRARARTIDATSFTDAVQVLVRSQQNLTVNQNRSCDSELTSQFVRRDHLRLVGHVDHESRAVFPRHVKLIASQHR